MPKVEHAGKGKYCYSVLRKNDFEIFLDEDIIELSYDSSSDCAGIRFPLETLEEFIKTYKENLRG